MLRASVSGGRSLRLRVSFQNSKNATTARKLTASIQKGPDKPTTATRTPAAAGPPARARLKATLRRATAANSSFRGTSVGTTAFCVGRANTLPVPSSIVNISTSHGVASPKSTTSAIATALAIMASVVIIKTHRRSKRSPTAPARMDSSTTGRNDAVCTKATMVSDAPRSVISQPAPTAKAQVPLADKNSAPVKSE